MKFKHFSKILLSLSLILPQRIVGKQVVFIGKIKGSYTLSRKMLHYTAKIIVEDGVIKEITHLTPKEINKLKQNTNINLKIISNKKNNGFLYPGDYKKLFTVEEKTNLKKLVKKREEVWDEYIDIGKESLYKEDKIATKNRKQMKVIKKQRKKRWTEVYRKYRYGDYKGAIEGLEEFKKYSSYKGISHYWSGLCQSKLLNHDLAVVEFDHADQIKYRPKDLFFEYGKSLLAINQLPKAGKVFKQSFEKGFRKGLSKFYIGWVYELQKKYKSALKNYKEVLTYKNNVSKDTIQAVHLRVGKLYEKNAKKATKGFKRKYLIKTKVIHSVREGIELSPKTALAKSMKKYLDKLHRQYQIKLDIPYRKGDQGNYIRFDQTFGYATNAISVNETASSNRDTFSSDSQFIYKHHFSFLKGVMNSPEIRLKFKHHMDRTSTSIIKLDTYNISPALRSSYKYKIGSKKSELSFDLEYDYSAKDYNGLSRRQYYTTSYKMNLGNKFNFFPIGHSILKLKRDSRTYYDSTLNSTTLSIFFNQFFSFGKLGLVSAIVNADFGSVADDNNSTNVYMIRADYIKPKAFWKGNLTASFTLLITDTLKQKTTRGIENNWSPEIEWRRDFFKKFDFSIKYGYSKNNSKDTSNYGYDNHSVSLGLQFSP